MRVGIKTIFHALLLAALSLGVTGISSCDGPGKFVELTILHTNDIHSHLKAEPAGTEKNPYGLGGLARLKTLVSQIRATKTDSLLLDAGDWSEGTSYFNIDAGSNMLRLLGMIGYDAAVVGNHDFLNGPVELANTIERSAQAFPALGANKNLSAAALDRERARIERLVPEYTILTTPSGVRVAVIGILCTAFAYYEYFKPAVITDPVAKASAITQKIHDENLADVIVLLSHNSFDENVGYAKRVPWINAVISGHSHVKTPKAIEVTNAGQAVYVAETGQWGQFLGEMTLQVNREKRMVKLKGYALRPVSADLPEDPEIAAAIDEQDRALSARYGHDVTRDHVADCVDEMPHSNIRETVVGNLAADAYRLAAKADFGLETNSLISVALAPGPLSTSDLISVMPHIYAPAPDLGAFPEKGRTWMLRKLTLTGAQFKLLLNTVLKINGITPATWISVSGMKVAYSVNGSKVARRAGRISEKTPGLLPIREIQTTDPATGADLPLSDSASYTFAVHDGILGALRIVRDHTGLPIDLEHTLETGIEAWQAIFKLATELRTLSAADFEPSTRYRTLEADLMSQEHLINLFESSTGKSRAVEVTVRNQGLTRSLGTEKLRVFMGAVDDAVNDGALSDKPLDLWREAGIPALGAGEQTTLRFAVKKGDFSEPGMYSLKIEVVADDGNAANDVTRRHLKF